MNAIEVICALCEDGHAYAAEATASFQELLRRFGSRMNIHVEDVRRVVRSCGCEPILRVLETMVAHDVIVPLRHASIVENGCRSGPVDWAFEGIVGAQALTSTLRLLLRQGVRIELQRWQMHYAIKRCFPAFLFLLCDGHVNLSQWPMALQWALDSCIEACSEDSLDAVQLLLQCHVAPIVSVVCNVDHACPRTLVDAWTYVSASKDTASRHADDANELQRIHLLLGMLAEASAGYTHPAAKVPTSCIHSSMRFGKRHASYNASRDSV
jgi:hypothetical protein